MKALVTGAAGGIGGAIVRRLEQEGYEVLATDVAELDVSDPAAWEDLPQVDVACLNAGVVTGTSSIAELTNEQYRRILGANVDGVVYGVRALARTMAPGSRIVVTASLGGLVGIPSDPIYSATKHFVVGLVRSIAPELAGRGIAIDAVCPGIVDTTMIADSRAALEGAGFPLLAPDDVAEAVVAALGDDETGQAWVVQPGREPLKYRFPGVPGPRVPGAEGVTPPL
ncbi:MAG: SDR family oxidoreductase [Thermoleophilia bacterium]|nr:SDR family oxidoreductase [Thermoleophilia bacterium]